MDRNAVVIEAGGVQHKLLASHRDWQLLNGLFFSDGPLFLNTLAVYKNFTVAKGIPKGSKAEVNCFRLRLVTEQLLAAILRDIDLLQYNYSFHFTACPDEVRCPESGFMCYGYHASIITKPEGFCWLRLIEIPSNACSRLVGQLDIRNKSEIETDNWGTLKIKKRTDKVTWQNILPPFIEFLKQSNSKTVVVHHN